MRSGPSRRSRLHHKAERPAGPCGRALARPRHLFRGSLALQVLAQVGLCLCVLLGPRGVTEAQVGRATVREYRRTFTTYPFSDPNPIPVVGRIYPYFRFDGFTDKSVEREWTVVELENKYLRVMILPEIGGKIWTAIEKKTGKPFIYFNQVVKFRDIAMRGPWTSGGIEANYGIMGHTPTVATPVDYKTQQNPDGSVTCVIGALDLLTRTPWRLTISLPADAAYFSTSSYWYNASSLEQPYYSWMNAGLKASGKLEFVYPGTHYLGHGGEYSSWPTNAENGRNIAWYDRNDFGGYKSYHVFGTYTDFFGAYWHADDLGVVRWSPRDEKAGKKIWIWGLSRQGMIWEQLLTDHDGQYVEVQSGRLFNQTNEASTFTPFKHRGFAPHTADRWTEYWFPVRGTNGFVAASPLGALNVTRVGGRLALAFSPAQQTDDTIAVYDGDQRVYSRRVVAAPLEVFVDTLPSAPDSTRLTVTVGGHRLEYRADPSADRLSRPLESAPKFDWTTPYGLYLQGKEDLRQRDYDGAKAWLDKSIARDSNYVPALADRAMVAYRRMEYPLALDLARRALSIDTYDGAANYYFGLISRRMGHRADARDGLEVAALSAEYRGAAWTELTKLYMSDGDLDRAGYYAAKARTIEADNLDALQIEAVIARINGDRSTASRMLDRIESLDPLSHFVSAERGQSSPALLRGELPEQTVLELAAWYRDLGRLSEADSALLLAGEQAEALYWRSFLRTRLGKPDAAALLQRANLASPRLVFPFRLETVEVLRWATQQTSYWRPKYYLGLALWHLGNGREARELLNACGDEPDYAPFYAARAALAADDATAQADWRRAAALAPNDWRIGKTLAERFLAAGLADSAIATARRHYARVPENSALGMLVVRTLVAGHRYGEADQVLGHLSILPFEGANDGRRLYRETKLMLAFESLGRHQLDRALKHVTAAREWPERLGAGKPYPADSDERLEDWIEADIAGRRSDSTASRTLFERIAAFRAVSRSSSDVLTAWALDRLGRLPEGKTLSRQWLEAEPENGIAQWLGRWLAGNRTEPPASNESDEVTRVIRAWVRYVPQ